MPERNIEANDALVRKLFAATRHLGDPELCAKLQEALAIAQAHAHVSLELGVFEPKDPNPPPPPGP